MLAAAVVGRGRALDEASVLEPLRQPRGECRRDIQPIGEIDDAEGSWGPEDLDQGLVLERLETGRLGLLVDDAEDLANHVARFRDAMEIPLQPIAFNAPSLIAIALDPIADGVDHGGRTVRFRLRLSDY